MNFKVKPKDISPEAIAAGLAEGFTTIFGRSFVTQVDMVNGRIVVTAKEQISDSEVWTVNDVSIYTQQTPDKVLRWCQTRSRQQARREGRTPIPFKKYDAKTILFSRKEVESWWSAIEPSVIATFTKGKIKRK